MDGGEFIKMIKTKLSIRRHLSVFKILVKIDKKYPEISGASGEVLDKIRAFYELEMIKHTKQQDIIIIVLTIVNIAIALILGYLTFVKPVVPVIVITP